MVLYSLDISIIFVKVSVSVKTCVFSSNLLDVTPSILDTRLSSPRHNTDSEPPHLTLNPAVPELLTFQIDGLFHGMATLLCFFVIRVCRAK